MQKSEVRKQTKTFTFFFFRFLSSAGCHLVFYGAGDGARTRDIKLGKLALYQLSYARFFGEYYSGLSRGLSIKILRGLLIRSGGE